MIGILAALKAFMEMDAAVTVLGTLDAGLNVASLFGILRSKFKKDSVEYQIICALDESLNESCKKLGWEYDELAVSQEIDLDTLISSTLMTKYGLGQLFTKLVGVEVGNDALDVIIDCFDKNVAGKEKLHRYLDQKWKRYIDEKKIPSASVPISLTIIPASVDLIGREDDITAIRDSITKNNVVSLRADGGVGKTAVAARIINDIKEEIEREESPFKHVAWIISTGDLRYDLSNLAASSVEAAGSIDERFKAACAFLEDNPTFLVIDNMDYLPGHDETTILNTVSGRTKILITTRAKIVKIERLKQYSVKPIEKKDAISLFYRYYSNEDEVITSDNRNKECYVEKIVEAALCNALLVEMIAKMAFWEYMDNLEDLWGKLEKDVFGTDSEIDIENPHAYSHKQGELSEGDLRMLEQIRNLYQMSGLDDTRQELMRFIAAFPAESIIFADAFKWAGFKVSDLKYLTDRGWIEKAGEGYLIHTMVQGSVILQKKEFDIEKYENLIKELSNTDQYMPDKEVYTKVAERIIVPGTVCSLLIEKGSVEAATENLLNSVAWVYFIRGNYKKALEYYKKSQVICEKVLGLEHPNTATSYNKIGTVYLNLGNYEQALKYYKKSQEICEKVLGLEHPNTASSYRDVATVYLNQYNYEKALEYYKKSQEICEKVLGLKHLQTALSYNGVATVYLNQYNYEKALEYYKKSQEIFEKVLGLKHLQTVSSYSDIATVYLNQGNYENALEYYKKAQVIYENVLGVEHPLTASSYSSMGTVYFKQHNYKESLKYYEKALAICVKVLGVEHPQTASSYSSIGPVYLDQGNYEKALEYYEKALEICEKVLGVEHPQTASSYNDIATVYHKQNNFEKELEYFEKALVIREKVLGLEHPDTAMTYYHLGEHFAALQKKEKSKNYFQKAYDIFLKIFGSNHPKTKNAKDILDEVSQKLDE